MRLLGRLLFTLLVAGFIAGGAAFLWPTLAALLQQGDESEAARAPSIVYALDEERWTRFPFSAPIDQVRLVTNADVPVEALGEVEASWQYAVEYQLLNSAGRVRRDGILTMTARLPTYADPDTGELVPASTYALTSELPTSFRASVLDFADAIDAQEIRLRLAALDPALTGASVRVYERRPFREGRAEIAWQRLSPEDRRRLSRASVLPSSLLTSEEQARLLRNAWFPVGPRGVSNQDYELRTLLTLDEEFEGVRVRPEEAPQGLQVSPNQRLTVQLPELGGPVRFELYRGAGIPIALNVTWYGRGIDAREERSYRLAPGETAIEDTFPGGLLEITTDAPVSLRAALLDPDGEERDLTAEIGRLRAFEASEGLVYPVTPLVEGDHPFRLALRCVCFEEGRRTALPALSFLIESADGSVLNKGEIRFRAERAAYDRLSDQPQIALSEAHDVFFSLPAGAAQLVVSSDDPVLVAGFNRPAGLPRLFLIPEDYFASEPDGEQRRTWFAVRPAFWEERVAEGRAPVIVTPRSPPEDDPDILAGIYDWELFVPEGDWIARDLLLPRTSERDARAEALAVSFVEMPVGEEVEVTFATATGAAEVSPQVVFLRDSSDPIEIAVRVDGKAMLDTIVGTEVGALSLPEIAAGRHQIEIIANGPITVFSNQVEGEPLDLLRRRALRLQPGETVFEIEKGEGEELVIAHAFPTADHDGRQTLRVILEGIERPVGPLEQWTLTHRNYSLRLDPDNQHVPVLGADHVVGPGRRMLIALGSDFPAGPYRVRLVLEDAPELYLVLSRTTPGLVQQRAIVQE